MNDHSELKQLLEYALAWQRKSETPADIENFRRLTELTTPAALLALVTEIEVLTATGKFLGAGVDVLCPRCDQLKAEVEMLRSILSEARSMLNTVSECSSHECGDCREHAGLHRDGIDLVIGKSGES